MYDEILNRAKTIHNRKAKDYALACDKFVNFNYANQVAKPFSNSYKSFAVLIGTKLSRLSTLLSRKGKKPVNEPIEDTFVDLINYVALMAEYYGDTKRKRQEDYNRSRQSKVKRTARVREKVRPVSQQPPKAKK